MGGPAVNAANIGFHPKGIMGIGIFFLLLGGVLFILSPSLKFESQETLTSFQYVVCGSFFFFGIILTILGLWKNTKGQREKYEEKEEILRKR